MKAIIHKASDRGHANHGWLDSYHSFSFGDYYDSNKMGFGNLRVINDDYIAAGAGFGRHPHKDMEIITIMLSGTLRHEDSMGNAAEIKAGEIQVMSAGSGVFHSEFNASQSESVNLLQIWVKPNILGVAPRYDQKVLKDLAQKNQLYQILSPNKNESGVWIYQDAWFYLSEFDKESEISYQLKKINNGIYIFIIEGGLIVDGHHLDRRDAIAILDSEITNFKVKKDSKILLMEV